MPGSRHDKGGDLAHAVALQLAGQGINAGSCKLVLRSSDLREQEQGCRVAWYWFRFPLLVGGIFSLDFGSRTGRYLVVVR